MISSIRRVRPIDYSILLDPQPAGPPIGRYAGKEFSEFVRDAFGRLFVFAGIAPRRANGGFDDDVLRPGEFIVLPGLIYRHSGTGSRSPLASPKSR
jgi:hypothetical protein